MTHTHPIAAQRGDSVVVGAESIVLPVRTYLEEPGEEYFDALSEPQRLIARCLLARSADGFVRQRQVSALARGGEPWSQPYLLALLGDYVLEIHQALLQEFTPAPLGAGMIGSLVAANPDWWALLQARVVSYWAEYHRGSYPRNPGDRRLPPGYPAAEVVRRVAAMSDVPLSNSF